MKKTSAFAPGKIILSGEYAVLFDGRALALPVERGVNATYAPNGTNTLSARWHEGEREHPAWKSYVDHIIALCREHAAIGGTLSVKSMIPLGKGMGSSTALIVAVTRATLGTDCESQAKRIEDELAPDNSGIDFSVIWNDAPTLFSRKNGVHVIDASVTLPTTARLIDTGTPDQPTSELVAWVRERRASTQGALDVIAECTERLIEGDDVEEVLKAHHEAQCELGVVPPAVRELIADIEREGGSAKVVGAGARTGGGGMVLALNVPEDLITKKNLATVPLSDLA